MEVSSWEKSINGGFSSKPSLDYRKLINFIQFPRMAAIFSLASDKKSPFCHG
jgi:hypothetical protein